MRILRLFLGILLLITGLNAIGGGWYAMIGAPDVPVEWLKNSVFQSYFIPGLFLMLVIGGLSMISAILVFKKTKSGLRLALYTSGVLVIWIAIQMAIIGYVSWLQPLVAIVAFIMAILALSIRRFETGSGMQVI